MVRPSDLQGVSFAGLRSRVAGFIENTRFTRFITAVILINAVTLGLETDADFAARTGEWLGRIDRIALTIFAVEIALKFFVYRFSFFKAGWNVFDFIIIAIALIPAVGPLSVLRALRALRVLRLVSVVPQMRRVIAALFHAIPGIASILAVLLIIFYVASVLVTKLFGADFPEMFGSVAGSMYTLFQIMTLEGWSEEVVRPVMRVYPWSWLFFIPFIIVTSFAVLNLFIGIIVDAMNFVQDDENESDEVLLRRDIRALKKDVSAIRNILEK